MLLIGVSSVIARKGKSLKKVREKFPNRLIRLQQIIICDENIDVLLLSVSLFFIFAATPKTVDSNNIQSNETNETKKEIHKT